MPTQELGQILLWLAVVFLIVGGLLLLAPQMPFLGKLPGDIAFDVGRVHVSIPIMTSIILSIVLTIVLNLVTRR